MLFIGQDRFLRLIRGAHASRVQCRAYRPSRVEPRNAERDARRDTRDGCAPQTVQTGRLTKETFLGF